MTTEALRNVRLSINNGQDVHFAGELLGEYSTQNKAGTKDRWGEIRLWQTQGGAWILEEVGRSTRQGESDMTRALVIEEPDLAWGELESGQRVFYDEGERHATVMGFLGWTIVAKAFARKMGWNVVREVL